jgi:hypothetical protein
MASAAVGSRNVGAPPRSRRARLVVAALGACLLLLIAGLAAVLSRSDVRRTGMNRVRVMAQLDMLRGGQTLCQRGELVPGGTGAIAASLLSPPEGGAAVRIAVIAGGTTVARGGAPAGWRGEALTIPLRPVLARATPARVCVTAAGGGLVGLAGEAAADGRGRAAIGRRALGGELRLVYLRPHAESWWSSAPAVVRRLGAGHPLGGSAIAVLLALLVASSVALASWQLAKGER